MHEIDSESDEMNSPEMPDGLALMGEFIRAQRKMMELSQRELAKLTKLSDPYVSQIERGLHEPSIRVLRSIADALNVRAETLLQMAGLLDETTPVSSVEEAINGDEYLSTSQKTALLGVYRGFRNQADQD